MEDGATTPSSPSCTAEEYEWARKTMGDPQSDEGPAPEGTAGATSAVASEAAAGSETGLRLTVDTTLQANSKQKTSPAIANARLAAQLSGECSPVETAAAATKRIAELKVHIKKQKQAAKKIKSTKGSAGEAKESHLANVQTLEQKQRETVYKQHQLIQKGDDSEAAAEPEAAPASAAIRAEISALRGKISKLPGKKNAKARKTINRSIRELEGALAAAEHDLAPYQAHDAPAPQVDARVRTQPLPVQPVEAHDDDDTIEF